MEERDYFNDDTFTIDDDHKAEWALRKIAEEEAEAKRISDACQAMIDDYKKKQEEAIVKAERRNEYLKGLLLRYFRTVPHKSTKTQESYALPSGKLVLKQPQATYEYDEAGLLGVCKARPEMAQYVRTVEKVAWGDLRKAVKALPGGEVVLDATGEILPGIRAVLPPQRFEIKMGGA